MRQGLSGAAVEDWASRGRMGRHPMETDMNEPMQQLPDEDDLPSAPRGYDRAFKALKIILIAVGVLAAIAFALFCWLMSQFRM